MPTLPQRIFPGNTLGLISPASPPADPKAVDRSIVAIEEMGFKVKLGKHARKRLGFLAGTDKERAADLMQMFTDKKVNGIVCIRGGYGTPRLLPLLDYDTIRRHPKVFVGFSDVTALHCAFLLKANLQTFHGPMAASLSQKDTPKFTRESWLKILTQPTAAGSILHGCNRKTVSVIRGGKVSGQLIGGNLTLLTTMLGTPFAPSLTGKILFFEDVNEQPYRLDRMLTQLLNASLLQKVAGIAVGICSECDHPKAKGRVEFRQSLDDVLLERLRPLNIPVVTGLPFGHAPYNATLPFGGHAILDGNRADLLITQPAVL